MMNITTINVKFPSQIPIIPKSKIKYIVNTPLSSWAYQLGCYFRWRGIDFMDSIIFICLLPACFILENILKAGFKEEGYIIAAEAIKVK